MNHEIRNVYREPLYISVTRSAIYLAFERLLDLSLAFLWILLFVPSGICGMYRNTTRSRAYCNKRSYYGLELLASNHGRVQVTLIYALTICTDLDCAHPLSVFSVSRLKPCSPDPCSPSCEVSEATSHQTPILPRSASHPVAPLRLEAVDACRQRSIRRQ
jgi:hypothetical protein